MLPRVRFRAAFALPMVALLWTTATFAAPEPPRLEHPAALTYPPEANGARGEVWVQVEVDASGHVHHAEVVSGPGVFHRAAVRAALRLHFKPALLDGTAVNGTERVLFVFEPPSDTPDDAIIVVSEHRDDATIESRETLGTEAIEQHAGQSFAQVVSDVAGVTLAQGTGASYKPIVRGFTERRLLVLNDGIRHASQKWGPDHGTEIDPFSAGALHVVRGAAGARFGADAMGGALIVQPPPMRTDVGVGGAAMTSYSSNGRRPYAALRLDLVPAAVPALSLRIEGNAAQSASLRAPSYVLGNTAQTRFNVGAAASLRVGTSQIRATWHHHDDHSGVFYGVQHGTPADIQAQLDADQPVNADQWNPSRTIDRPSQSVTHDTAALHITTTGAWGSVRAVYAYQHNRRREFEQVRDNVTGPQYDFTLRTHSLDAAFTHRKQHLGGAVLSGEVGIQSTFQENVYTGFALMPNHRSSLGGLHARETLAGDGWQLQVGGRLDVQRRDAFLGRTGTARLSSSVDGCATEVEVTRCTVRTPTASGSFGALWKVVPDRLALSVELTSASRTPHTDELYITGYAPSLPVMAYGDPSLGTETAWASTATARWTSSALHAEMSGYASRVDGYVVFRPTLNNAGNPQYDVTIRGAWPRFAYTAAPVNLWGADGSVQVAPHAWVGLDVSAAVVRAHDRHSGSQMPGLPSDRVDAELIFRRSTLGSAHDLHGSVGTEWVARQGRLDPSTDIAPAPPSFVLLHAQAQVTVQAGLIPLRIGMNVSNILNTKYREITSLLRYYADQPGRDVRVHLGTDF